MVKNITAFGRSGLSDWFVQRVTSVIVASYVFFILGYLVLNQPVTFIDWYEFYAGLGIRIYTIVVLLSLVIHAWIGMWTILTDYVKPTWARILFEVVIILVLAAYLLWGVFLLFGL
ncbi:MAG: succinate dehydrogenase, hydrophobic membrane anchor protein [Gammaproteobacteria bacterium]